MIVLPEGENRMIVASFISTKHRNMTEDGQTDRRTDGQTPPCMAYTALAVSVPHLISDVLANRRNIHHRPALLWRFRDSDAGYKTAYLLTYLQVEPFWLDCVLAQLLM